MKKLALLATIGMLCGCSYPQAISYNVAHSLGKKAPQSAPNIANEKRKVGNPYKVMGKWYYPRPGSAGYRQKGIASWYGTDFHAKKTANGETYNMYAYTAAHKTLPLPTYARVTNLNNNRSIVVRINDRGPFVKDREIDMSYAGAIALGFDKAGTAPVLVEAISIYGGDVNRTGRKMRYTNKPTHKRAYKTNYSVQKSSAGSFTHRVVNKNQGNELPVATPGVYIQLGAFSDVRNARQLYYKAKNITQAKIKQIQIKNRTIYRVVVDDLKSLQHAQNELTKLHDNGLYNAIIRKN